MDGQVVERVSPLDELDGRTGGWSRWFPLLVVVAALGYVFVSPYARGSDSSGYLNSPDYSTHGNLLALVRVLPGFSVTEFWTDAYQPQGFKIRDNSDGAMSPTYRTGFPMHIALATFFLVAAVYQWGLADWGQLDYAHTMRWVIPGTTFIALGFLTVLSSFFLSILGMRRR